MTVKISAMHPAFASNRALRQLFDDGGARINGEPVSQDRMVSLADVRPDGTIRLSIGKKVHIAVVVV